MQHNSLAFFAKFIETELGIIYTEANYYQLQNRLDEIARVLHLKDSDELYREAQKSMTSQIRQLLLDIATNNETSFFRDPKVFKAIETQLGPRLKEINKTGAGPLKIWSAACSYGQEPFSLTMLLREWARANGEKCHVQITATDIASHVLERAQKGRFTQLEVQRGLAASLMVRYFKKDADNFWTASEELRSLITFKKLNLLESFQSMSRFDVILCRNVLIYQSPENKKKVIAKLAAQLEPNGILVLGAGESLLGLSDEFDTVRCEDSLVYQRKAQRPGLAA